MSNFLLNPLIFSQEGFSINGTKMVAGNFEVTFPSVPNVSDTFSEHVKGKRIELLEKSSETVLRCEFIPLPAKLAGAYGKEQIIQSLLLRAKGDGLDLPSVRYEATTFGHKAVMRGNKTLGTRVATFETTCYATQEYVLTVFIAGAASGFPSDSAMVFKRSVKYKGKQADAP
jgi:hypothetical protein